MSLKMHTTYTYTQEKKSLKNTKINYTKDLLRHCLLIFWEDFCKFFFSVCAASLSPSKVLSFILYKSLPLPFSFVHVEVSATSPHLGVKSAQ